MNQTAENFAPQPTVSTDLSAEARAIIAEEERIFASVIASLKAERESDSRRLHTETHRARALTAELVAARRVEDKAMLASDESVSHTLVDKKERDIEIIDKLLTRPYFARIVLEEDEGSKGTRPIEYKLGFFSNSEARIVDWRKAPISKLYYEYREGDVYDEIIQGKERSGTIRLRHGLEITKGKLTQIQCRLGTFQKQATGWVQIRGSHGSASRDGATRTGAELPTITSLITPEQFAAITQPTETALFIQGIAGSGKTTVALHRLAWLLSERRNEVSPETSAIIVMSKTMQRFVQRARVELGLEDVPLWTFHDWAGRLLPEWLPQCRSSSGTISRPDTALPSSLERVARSLALYRAAVLHLKEPSPWSAVKRALQEPSQLLKLDETRLLDADIIQQLLSVMIDAEKRRVVPQALDGLLLSLGLARTPAAISLPNGKRGHFGHIVVDEVQDLGAVELKAITAAVKSRADLTLVGDVGQKLDKGASFPGWERLSQLEGKRPADVKLMSLTVSHRSTLPIMRLAEHVRGETLVSGGRAGRVPIWFRCANERLGLESLFQWLDQALVRYPTALTAVICATPDVARQAFSLLQPKFKLQVRLGTSESFTFDEGLLVTDVKEARGLEFLNVLIWNPSEKAFPKEALAQNMLYVALTRAEENLALVTWNKPSALLPSHVSPLVRGLEVRPEEN